MKQNVIKRFFSKIIAKQLRRPSGILANKVGNQMNETNRFLYDFTIEGMRLADSTAKEAYNLLSGRSVNKDLTNKEGQPFNAWLQLDFKEEDKNENFKVKQYHQGYGYELEAVLNKYPIKELSNDEEKVKLMKSLEKGNQERVLL